MPPRSKVCGRSGMLGGGGGGREVVEKARKLREADYLVAALDSVGLGAGARPDFPG